MPDIDLTKDLREEAARLERSADQSPSAGEKRMLKSQATFYEEIAAQEDAAMEKREHGAQKPETPNPTSGQTRPLI